MSNHNATCLALGLGLLLSTPSLAQPQYTVQTLGPGLLINDMNLSGEIVGWTVVGGNVQAFVVGPSHAYQTLPLPPGYGAAWAQGINDLGVVVGSASVGSFPEFGQAVSWTPNGAGGYSTQLLGTLPNHTMSVAYDVNNRGDIVGSSLIPGFGGGPTVWFNSPSGVLDLGALGAPSSVKEINDNGVLVGINGGLFDIDTLTATPLPSFTGNQTGFQGWAINNHQELGGKGIFGSQVAATRWTAAQGWQTLSLVFGQSAEVQTYDINDSGVTVLEAPAPAAHFTGVGTFSLASLLGPGQQGQWSFVKSLGLAVNNHGQIAAIAQHNGGPARVVIMTPIPSSGFFDLGFGLAGSLGVPVLSGSGSLSAGSPMTLDLNNALPSASAYLIAGTTPVTLPFMAGTLVPSPDVVLGLIVNASGGIQINTVWPALPTGANIYLQYWIVDAAGQVGLSASNGLRVTQP